MPHLQEAVTALVVEVNSSAGNLPTVGVVLARRITDVLAETLHVSDGDLGVEARFAVHAIATDYLPTTMRTYVRAERAGSERAAEELVRQLRELVDAAWRMLTSSGYANVPPAAASLTTPMVLALRDHGYDARPFRVQRAAMTDGDYAKMYLADRRAALSSEGLHVDERIDDVRMTGVHETALDHCLRNAGARNITHAYILDAYSARRDPRTEATLNQLGAASTSELLSIANDPVFYPNARFCKRILAMRPEAMAATLRDLPGWVVNWLDWAVLGGHGRRLRRVSGLSRGCLGTG